MKKLNVLFLGTNLEVGGDTLSTLRLARELDKRGHRIFYMAKNGPLLEELKETNISYIENLFVGGHAVQSMIKGALEIYKFLRHNVIDIIHIQTAPSIIMAYFARKCSSKCKKTVIVWHNRGVKKLTYFFGTRFVINPLVDFVISISNYERNKLIKNGITPQKVEAVYHGVYLSCTKEIKKPDIRAQYNIDSNSPLIGIVARLDPFKGHKYFIKAANIVLEKIPSTRFLIVGDGSLKNKLKKLTKKLDIEKEVIFTGTRKDMKNVYSSIDILVYPSLWESLCNVLLEAMFMGKPIIATNGSSIPEIIEDGVDGILVPPKDPSAVAEKILYLLENKNIARKLSHTAKKKAENLFSVEKQVKKIEEIYYSLLKARD